MKLSLNGNIERVLELDDKTIVEFTIPPWLTKNILELDKSKKYNLSITNVKSRKTLEQNNVSWAIMRDIARVSDKDNDVEMVYRDVLALANIKSTFLMTVPEAKEELEKVYRVVIDHGSRDTKDNKGNNLHTYECLVGMSNFDRKEMRDFIDALLRLAYEHGVDTTRYE